MGTKTNESVINIFDVEQEVNMIYKDEINKLISQYEVYNHDLHPNINENIVILFQTLALAKTNSDDYDRLINAVKSQTLIIKRELYVRLMDIYYKKIKLLRRNNRLYKQKAVVLENSEIKFKKYTDDLFSTIRKDYIVIRKKYAFVLKTSSEKETLLDNSSLCEISTLYNKMKDLLDKYEEYVPMVINSGYKGLFVVRAFKNMYTLISFALTVIGLVLFILSRFFNFF